MALDADVLAAIRAHIGTAEPPSDEDLEAAYERLGSVPAVALEVVRGRLAELRSRPAVLRVDGDHSEDWTAIIKSLAEQENALTVSAEVAAAGGTVKVARLARAGRAR